MIERQLTNEKTESQIEDSIAHIYLLAKEPGLINIILSHIAFADNPKLSYRKQANNNLMCLKSLPLVSTLFNTTTPLLNQLQNEIIEKRNTYLQSDIQLSIFLLDSKQKATVSVKPTDTMFRVKNAFCSATQTNIDYRLLANGNQRDNYEVLDEINVRDKSTIIAVSPMYGD